MIPVYGQGFFIVTHGLIHYIIVFDYIDEEGEYASLSSKPDLLAKEEDTLRRNMQELMDEERVIINGLDVRPRVENASIEIRENKGRVSVTFYTTIPYRPRIGRNIYENFYEPTQAEYPYTVYWIAQPCIRIEAIESPGEVTLKSNIAIIKVNRGTKIDGYESVVFTLEECSYRHPQGLTHARNTL
ncbi:MAG: hypothetical protein F7C81_02410 [Desulfurococcales archaeon]|nr:hypothetical protein [Desulfurococcales archaeon]